VQGDQRERKKRKGSKDRDKPQTDAQVMKCQTRSAVKERWGKKDEKKALVEQKMARISQEGREGVSKGPGERHSSKWAFYEKGV